MSPLLVPADLDDADRAAIDEAGRTGEIDDIHGALLRFPDGSRCTPLSAADAGEFPPRMRYTRLDENANGNENHFQGAERLGRYLLISGGDWREPAAHLFVVRMGSQPERGPWKSNAGAGVGPQSEDMVVGTIVVDAGLWHAGGMDTLGPVLAVPVEYPAVGGLQRFVQRLRGVNLPDLGSTDRSRVTFYHMADPERPKRLPCAIERSGRKATAVAIARLPNLHYLVAVLSAPAKDRVRLDFYLSDTAHLGDIAAPAGEPPCPGFARPPAVWLGATRDFPHYQALDFVRQADDTLFLVGLHNTSDKAPFRKGDDEIGLWKVEFEASTDEPPPIDSPLPPPRLTFIARKSLDGGDACNMDAGAGLYIEDGGVFVYGVAHWRTPGGTISMAQFAPPE